MLPSQIVGRDEEIAALTAFLDTRPEATSALVLEGDAGIGKSTIWREGLARARARGLRVMVSRPAEAEQRLVYAGLGDLLEDVLDEVLPSLAPPRRRALKVATLRDDASGDPVDRRAVGLALRDVLHHLGEHAPVLVAVDDEQWLDASSSAALAFALRRLSTSRVLVLLALRTGGGSPTTRVEDALPASRVRRVPIGPLSVGALHRLLRDRLGTGITRQTLRLLFEQSGGNPFFAIEIARVLDPDLGPFDPVPVPRTLEELLGARLAGLPAPTLEALAFAAAYGTAPVALLREAASTWVRSSPPSRPRWSSGGRERSVSPIPCSPRCSTGTSGGTGSASTRRLRGWPPTRLFGPATSPWPPRSPTLTSRRRSTRRRELLSSGERPRRRRSLPSMLSD